MARFLQEAKQIHMIGIGGSGMFPLAQILATDGHILTGSDNNETETLKAVRKLGAKVFLGHKAEQVQGADLVVYSAAINPQNPELLAAKALGIETMERSRLLGLVTEAFSNVYGVCGTHGKTTTTALLSQIFLTAKVDMSAVIGGKLPLMGGSGRLGQSQTMVCESCEYVDTFLALSPNVAVLLNIDNDHLEYFKTMENLKASFTKFCAKADRCVIYNGDDQNSRDAVQDIVVEKRTFGFDKSNMYTPDNITIANGRYHFDVLKNGRKILHASLHIPGRHNIYNALAAIACADLEGVAYDVIADAVLSFGGAGRRFERLGEYQGVVIADDYAHHPTELEATLTAAKSLDYGQVWAVFQPFTFSRTAMLMDDFARVLKLADRVVLSPIMGSREVNTYGVTSEQLAEKVPGCVVLETFEQIAEYVRTHAKKGDLVLTLGCGDIYKAAMLMIE